MRALRKALDAFNMKGRLDLTSQTVDQVTYCLKKSAKESWESGTELALNDWLLDHDLPVTEVELRPAVIDNPARIYITLALPKPEMAPPEIQEQMNKLLERPEDALEELRRFGNKYRLCDSSKTFIPGERVTVGTRHSKKKELRKTRGTYYFVCTYRQPSGLGAYRMMKSNGKLVSTGRMLRWWLAKDILEIS